MRVFFFFNDTATTEIYTLSLHDALPIFAPLAAVLAGRVRAALEVLDGLGGERDAERPADPDLGTRGVHGTSNVDRKSTRLNSSHANISYAVFCLKKKKLSLPARKCHAST